MKEDLRPTSRALQQTSLTLLRNLSSQERSPLPGEEGHPDKSRALSGASASLSNLREPSKQGQTTPVIPGLLTSIVKTMRKSTRTQNRVDLAELLRRSVQLSAQESLKTGEYSLSRQDRLLKEKGLKRA